MKKYIGIDISKASIDVYDGTKSHLFSNDEKGFKKIVGLTGDQDDICWVYEPTGVYSYAITRFCQDNRIKVVIVSPKVARDFSRSLKVRSKTDRIDAKVLYHYQQNISDKDIHVPSVDQDTLIVQQRFNAYEQLQNSRQRLRDLIEATSKDDKALIGLLDREIRSITKTMERLFKEIKSILLQTPKQVQQYEMLRTIPSVGEKSAIYLMSLFMRYPHANVRQLTALVGLDPVLRDSGMFKGKARLSKQGGKRLRDALFMPILSATMFNDRIRVFYYRLVKKGKPKKLALLAAMKKLVLISFAVYKTEKAYVPLSNSDEILNKDWIGPI